MKLFPVQQAKEHPLSLIYAVLLLSATVFYVRKSAVNGAWDSAIVDCAMACLLIVLFLRRVFRTSWSNPGKTVKIISWAILFAVNLCIFIPCSDFFRGISSALTLLFLFFGFVLHFSGSAIALRFAVPALWCFVFIPYREEILLLASYPLRLSAAAFSELLLRIFNIEVIASGSSLHLSNLNIAITDACSGINQLDAFLLLSCIAVEFMHRKTGIKILHFAFIIPAMITGNTVRIVLTIGLYYLWGKTVLDGVWHIALGYVQIILAMIIFLAIGMLFREKQGDSE